MTSVKFGGSNDGPRLTISQALRTPNFIPERALALMENQFLVDSLLRQGPPADSGAVAYRLNQPLFADADPEIVEEFGEIPIITTSRGALVSAHTVKRAAGLVVSREMRDRNDVSTLNLRMTQLKNTFTRAYDKLFMATVLNNGNIQTFVSGHSLGSSSTTRWNDLTATTDVIRRDLAQAKIDISNAHPSDQPDGYFGFVADTLVISPELAAYFMVNDNVNEVFAHGVLADQQLTYTGVLPNKFFGLDVVQAHALTGKNTALVMQRNVCGFISDERPLEATPMYAKPEVEAWRSDFVRRSVAALDQPLAVVAITGVES